MKRLLILATAAGLLLAGCSTSGSGDSIAALEGVVYSQQQAVPGFDTSEFTIQGDDLDGLVELMEQYQIDPKTFAGGGDACPGGVSTDATFTFNDGSPDNSFSMNAGCGEGFIDEASVFLQNYSGGEAARDNGYGSIDYAQSQAVPDFDDSVHTQADPGEIAKFVALLDQYDIDPDGYVSTSEAGCAGGVRTVVSLFDTSSPKENLAARMEIDGCGKSSGFDAEATTLLSGWRESDQG